MSPKITDKISLNKTFNNFPRKKSRHNLFTTFTVNFVSRSIGEKNLNFFFKNLPPNSQKKRQNSTKKIIKKSFLEEILLNF
jgi:hypothetical protein